MGQNILSKLVRNLMLRFQPTEAARGHEWMRNERPVATVRGLRPKRRVSEQKVLVLVRVLFFFDCDVPVRAIWPQQPESGARCDQRP
jgi:hypothetical protein